MWFFSGICVRFMELETLGGSPGHGAPTVEVMPWNLAKSPHAIAHKMFPARWARLRS